MGIGYLQAEGFRSNNMSYMECMVTGNSFKHLLKHCYGLLIRRKYITPMEELPKDEKQRLFEIIKDFAPHDYTKEQYVDACRGLYTLEYYLQNNP